MDAFRSLPTLGKERRTQLSTLQTAYQYQPLKSPDVVRLMTLLPGEFSSEIRICLERKQFTEQPVPEFEALSYAWGSIVDPVNIFVGEAGYDTLFVTQNLAEALPYLRYREKPRVLWIDAICVNQQDLEERSSQVNRMADIYSKATRVVVWLGPQSHDSALALECIETASSNISVNWENSTMAPLSAESESLWSDKDSKMPFNEEQVLAIAGFFSRSWFERLWIRQEISLARDAIAICGPQSVPWLAIRDIVFYIYVRIKPQDLIDNLPMQRQEMLLNLCRGRRNRSFGLLLSEAKYSICSDPRDKVFALLSLIHPGEKIKIEPDYTKSVYEVYQDVMVQFIAAGGLQLLSTIEMHEHLEGVPSWVPDWASPRLSERLRNHNAAAQFKAMAEFRQHGILQVTGVLVGVIEDADAFNFPSDRIHGSQAHTSNILELQRVVNHVVLQGMDVFSKPGLHELCQALFGNDVSERYSPFHPSSRTLANTERFLIDILNFGLDLESPKYHLTRENNRILFFLIKYCRARCLFRSANGRLGRAPKTARAGDIITVVLGLGSPLILRPTNDNKFQVVGEAYYNGVMDGEALLGPLPDGIKEVSRYSPVTARWHFAYFDGNNNTVTTVDPRLGDMPPDWKIKSEPEDEVLQWFVNKETGESTWKDPRQTLQLLEKRGVDLRVFDLI